MTSILLAAALVLSTPEEAVALLAADAPRPAKEDFEAAAALIDVAAEQEPANPRWTFGRGLVALFSGKGLEGRDLLERAAKEEPNRSDYQYWHGASVFESIDEVGMLGKMGAASKGKAALRKG